MANNETKKYTFSESFGYGPKNTDYFATFDMVLSDEEVEFLRAFLKENGDCDYGYLESDNPHLFNRINDAANEAVLTALNKRRWKHKLDFDDVDWCSLSFDFCWPEELLK